MLCGAHRHAAGGNYSGAFVNEFKIFVAELRDFFNAVGLTQLLDGVKNGMSAEDQQVCITAAWVLENAPMSVFWGVHAGWGLGALGSCHHTLNHSKLLGSVKSGMGSEDQQVRSSDACWRLHVWCMLAGGLGSQSVISILFHALHHG